MDGAKFFSRIGLVRAYNEIPIAAEDSEEVTITYDSPIDLFQFLKMWCGFRKASSAFQRFLHEVLEGLEFCFVYIDDAYWFSLQMSRIINNI